ncbi:unnamed protein product [Urochloa decumbens]|uniref:Uncharacterized protein n=1 Tax=Urochloa decumbens TaxID=240449 RepID=A0ABC9G764_9POAL
MGNCPPLPCPSPCPDLSFQEICANNNCHGCCIFHCSNPGVQAEEPVPAWDSPPAQTRQFPHFPPPQPGSAREVVGGGMARDVVPAIGYRSWAPSPWCAEPGLVATVATEHDTNDSHGVTPPPPPHAPRNGDRPVPWLAEPGLLAAETAVAPGNDGRGVPRWPPPPSVCIASGSAETRNRGQPAAQPARRAESCLAETWAATGRDAGALAADMPLAAPPGVPRHGRDRRWAPPPPPPRTEPCGSSAVTGAMAGRDESRAGVALARDPGQPVRSPRRAVSGLAETWATVSRDASAAAESGQVQDTSMRRDTWSPVHNKLPASRSRDPQQGQLPPSPSSSSLSAAGRLSPAESRRRLATRHDVGTRSQ